MTATEWDPYLGPDPELMAMLDRAAMADRALLPPESDAEHAARAARLVSVQSFADLDEGDREWLNLACLVVSAGGAPRMLHPEAVGDFAAEDAALEAGAPVPVPDPEEVDDAPVSVDEAAELAMYEDDDVPGVDDEGWVGL